MGDALFGSKPDIVNAAGSSFTDADRQSLTGSSFVGPGGMFKVSDFNYGGKPPDAAKMATMFTNWLTAGGPPKPIDPGQIFAEEGTVAAQQEKGGAGAGFSGLFGFGNMIGQLAPLNQSPMQPGVPYAAPPVPGGGK